MYKNIYDYENLLLAWKKTQRLKKYRDDVMQFSSSMNSVLGHSMYSRNFSYRKTLSDKLEAACSMK